MIHKTIVPDAQQLGESPVQILKIGSRGLDKTASMQKRAAAFADIIADIKPMQKKAYLHVITTGAYEYYGSQRNADAFNEDHMTIYASEPKDEMHKVAHLGGGLRQFHDKSYMHGGHVYQEHQTQREGAKPSGIVKAAKYNEDMHRGELLIEVDADAWRDRLNKKASGQDIYLSIGCDVPKDICSICLNEAHTLKEHCDHVTLHKNAVYEDGNRACMFNDQPQFYDISGVNVPADPIAFVLKKVASGEPADKAVALSRYMVGTRPALPLGKIASTLNKLSKIQKQIICKPQDDILFEDQPEAIQDFLHGVEKYPTDQVISGCNRKGILLTPEMLFRLMGRDTDQPELFDTFAKKCPLCGQHIMQDMQEDELFPSEMHDGSFDTKMLPDINLMNILQSFMPDFGVSRPAINGKAIRITIRMGTKPDTEKDPEALMKALDSEPQEQEDKPYKYKGKNTKEEPEEKSEEESEDIEKKASLVNDEFRRTYARYVLSFASQNSDDTCMLAMQKIARFK